MSLLLSILIPVYNSEKYLKKCIDSLLLPFEYRDLYEIIVVNDGSNDNSLSILESYSFKYNFISVFTQSNKGQSSARNFGLRNAKGKYIFFVDSDDFVYTDSLKFLLNICESKNLDILFFKHFYGKEKYLEGKRRRYKIVSVINNPIMTGIEYLSLFDFVNAPWACLFSREFLINSSLFFKEGYYLEDGIYMMEALIKANKVSFINLYVYFYVQRIGSTLHIFTQSHLRKLNDAFVHAIDYMDYLIKSLDIDDKNAVYRCMAHRDSFIISLLFRFLRFTESGDYVMNVLSHFENKGLYPIICSKYLPLKIKLVYWILNNKKIYIALFSTIKYIERYKHKHFYNVHI